MPVLHALLLSSVLQICLAGSETTSEGAIAIGSSGFMSVMIRKEGTPQVTPAIVGAQRELHRTLLARRKDQPISIHTPSGHAVQAELKPTFSNTLQPTGPGQAQAALKMLDNIYGGKSLDPWLAAAGEVGEVATVTGDAMAHVYGELLPSSAATMFERMSLQKGQRFYDLGSGLGKIVVLGWLLGFNTTGVELARTRLDFACKSLAIAGGKGRKGGVQFLHASFLDVDFSDADAIFSDSVEFSKPLLDGLANIARRMKPGSKIVTANGLPGPGFIEKGKLELPASWAKTASWQLQEVSKDAAATTKDIVLPSTVHHLKADHSCAQ